AKQASALTNQLLAFSRKQVVQPVPVNLNDSVMQMQRMLKRLIGEDIVIQTALDANLPAVLADPGQIEQILLNLAVNARDAMPDGGTLRLSTAVVGHDYSRWPTSMTSVEGVLLTVTDTGAGMTPEVQAHIFEPFFTTKRGAGTG